MSGLICPEVESWEMDIWLLLLARCSSPSTGVCQLEEDPAAGGRAVDPGPEAEGGGKEAVEPGPEAGIVVGERFREVLDSLPDPPPREPLSPPPPPPPLGRMGSGEGVAPSFFTVFFLRKLLLSGLLGIGVDVSGGGSVMVEAFRLGTGSGTMTMGPVAAIRGGWSEPPPSTLPLSLPPPSPPAADIPPRLARSAPPCWSTKERRSLIHPWISCDLSVFWLSLSADSLSACTACRKHFTAISYLRMPW